MRRYPDRMEARPTPPAETWIVTDGAAGNLRPAQALAGALGVAAREWIVAPPPPWGWLAPRLRTGAGFALPPALRDAAARAAPDLVIGCGRRAALATAWLRRTHGVFAVQILDPRVDPAHWDVVVAPAHDRLDGPNVLSVTGALHGITPAVLAEAAVRHADLARVPTPRTAVLLGGPTRAARLDDAWLAALCGLLRGWHAVDGGGLLVTTSRRTPRDWVPALREQLAEVPSRLWTGEADGPNPYLGMLAHAQRLVVSPDSANLLAEACATGKPVFVHAPRPVRGRLGELQQSLLVDGRIRPLRAEPADWTPPPVPRELYMVAAEVGRRFESTRGKRHR
jgi:mitochondrial fission protein ELM1